MDVVFITTTSEKLDAVPVINGQVIALSDVDAYYYDQGNTRHSASQHIVTESLPSAGTKGGIYVVTGGSAPGMYVWNEDTFYKVCANADIMYVDVTKAGASTKSCSEIQSFITAGGHVIIRMPGTAYDELVKAKNSSTTVSTTGNKYFPVSYCNGTSAVGVCSTEYIKDDKGYFYLSLEMTSTSATSFTVSTAFIKLQDVVNAMSFSSLNTTTKTLVGAINEVKTTADKQEVVVLTKNGSTISESTSSIFAAISSGALLYLNAGSNIICPLVYNSSSTSSADLRFAYIDSTAPYKLTIYKVSGASSASALSVTTQSSATCLTTGNYTALTTTAKTITGAINELAAKTEVLRLTVSDNTTTTTKSTLSAAYTAGKVIMMHTADDEAYLVDSDGTNNWHFANIVNNVIKIYKLTYTADDINTVTTTTYNTLHEGGYPSLATSAKTIIGAINEVNTKAADPGNFWITVSGSTVDKAYAEISEAVSGNKAIFLKNGTRIGVLTSLSSTTSQIVARFFYLADSDISTQYVSTVTATSSSVTHSAAAVTFLHNGNYSSLNTTAKTVIGAINEVKSSVEEVESGQVAVIKDTVIPVTQEEYDALSEEQKAAKVYIVTDGGSIDEEAVKEIAAAEHVELTKAEYDALSDAEKCNGKVYFVTDEDDDPGQTGPTLETLVITDGVNSGTANKYGNILELTATGIYDSEEYTKQRCTLTMPSTITAPSEDLEGYATCELYDSDSQIYVPGVWKWDHSTNVVRFGPSDHVPEQSATGCKMRFTVVY